MKGAEIEKAMLMVHAMLIGVIIFLTNLIPIIGPSLASRSIGFNEFRWNMMHEGITRKFLITPIIIGHIIFFLFLGLFLSFGIEFAYQQYFWLIIGLGLVGNLVLSIIFYFVGVSIYKKRRKKRQLGYRIKK